MRRSVLVVMAISLAALLAGCAQPLGPKDAAALERLGEVAGPTSGVQTDLIDSTECWLPSAHPIDDVAASESSWRVLCRVYWHERDTNAARYQDTTCIGDFELVPMIDHCYRWTYYDLMPAYEDEPGVPTG